MNADHSTRCRVTEDELAHDAAHRFDENGGLADDPDQGVKECVEGLMGADSTDDDAIIVLMESERFIKTLRKLLSNRHDKERRQEDLVEDVVNMVSVAETVLSEYAESLVMIGSPPARQSRSDLDRPAPGGDPRNVFFGQAAVVALDAEGGGLERYVLPGGRVITGRSLARQAAATIDALMGGRTGG